MRAPRALIAVVDALDRRGAALAVRLTKLSGKSADPVHPKHLLDVPWHHWYVEHLGPDDRVLDLGCANGAHTLAAAPQVRHVIGVDRDRRAVAIAVRQVRERALANVDVLDVDVTAPLPFRDGSFDAVLFLDVIEHLVPRQAVLREIRRVLTRDGCLLVSAPNRDTSWRRRLRDAGLFAFSDSDHKIEYTRDELLAELGAAGFVAASDAMPVVVDTPWAGLIDAAGALSLALYARLARWKRDAALRAPGESTGFRVVARRRE